MTGLAAFLVDQWDALRLGSRSQWAFRMSLLAVLVASLATSWAWAGSAFAPMLLGVGVLLAAGAVWNPDSLAVGGFITASVGWWLLAGRPLSWWQPVVASLLLLAVHLISAGSATAPFFAEWSPAAIRSWAQPAALVFLIATVALGVTVAVAAIPAGVVPRGPLWILAAVTTVLGAALWARRVDR